MKNTITIISLCSFTLFAVHVHIRAASDRNHLTAAFGTNQVAFDSKNLMNAPYNVSSQHPSIDTTIKVVDIPKNTFIAAGVRNANNGKPNYSKQSPINQKTNEYVFNSNYSYAVIVENGNNFTSQHRGTDFIGKTTWNARKNIIS